MAIVGRNANRLDARATVSVGAVFFASMWLLSRMTLGSGPEETLWPLILRRWTRSHLRSTDECVIGRVKARELAQARGCST
jgi:hypothetical protein